MLFEPCPRYDREICAYHAVLDYNYSTAAVAAFLKVEQREVERMLTEHDTLR